MTLCHNPPYLLSPMQVNNWLVQEILPTNATLALGLEAIKAMKTMKMWSLSGTHTHKYEFEIGSGSKQIADQGCPRQSLRSWLIEHWTCHPQNYETVKQLQQDITGRMEHSKFRKDVSGKWPWSDFFDAQIYAQPLSANAYSTRICQVIHHWAEFMSHMLLLFKTVPAMNGEITEWNPAKQVNNS